MSDTPEETPTVKSFRAKVYGLTKIAVDEFIKANAHLADDEDFVVDEITTSMPVGDGVKLSVTVKVFDE